MVREGSAIRRMSGIALAVGLLLAGCGSSSAPLAGQPARGSEPASAPTAASPSAASVPVLPVSVLPPLPGLDYEAPPQGDAAAAATIAASSEHPESFAGALVRSVMQQGRQIGGVEILRLSPDVPLDGEAVTSMVAEFAQEPGGAALLAGRPVWQADDARGQGVGAVAWADGKDLVLVWAQGLDGARRLAELYLT